MQTPRLSVVVISKNEESSIGLCLRSVDFADEIVVVDNGSVDGTVEIARACGAIVIESPDWPGFGPQKNRALAAATGDWILSLDADEWIEAPLAAEIKRTIADPGAFAGFNIPRRSRFCGTIVRYSGWSPDYVLRLFRRDGGRFTNATVHEKVVVTGPVGRLVAPIDHDSIADLADAHDKIERYSTAAAERLVAAGKNSSIANAISHAAWAYLNTYFVRLGFLDGWVGYMVARYEATYTYRKWAKVALWAIRANAVADGPPAATISKSTNADGGSDVRSGRQAGE